MRMIVAAIAAMGIAVGLAANAQAQSFPSRPVSVIVTYPPGGPVDTVTRIVAEHMRGTLGQPFVVENVGGAGGSLGVGRLARSAANGYTLGVGDIGAFVLNGFRNRDLRERLFGRASSDVQERKRQSARVTRQLRLLRAHGLVQKVPKTHRYQVTPKGRTAINALLAARQADTSRLAEAG